MRRGGKDAWRTKAWRGLAKFFMLGSHLQATAVEVVPQEKVLPPEAVPSSSKLSQGGAEPGRRCCQDAWRTKAWRGLAKFFMLGSHLQATAVKVVPQEKVLPPEAVPSSSKLSQGGTESVRRCCQDAWRTKAWRGLAKFFMLGSHLQATAVEFVPQEKVLPPDSG